MPFVVTILIFQCSAPDLEQPHRHPGANLGKFDTLISCPHKDMMSHFDAIVNVLECNDPVADFLIGSRSLSWRE